eukprot:1263-Eustigmatos_ZCMA.PRE.1
MLAATSGCSRRSLARRAISVGSDSCAANNNEVSGGAIMSPDAHGVEAIVVVSMCNLRRRISIAAPAFLAQN